MLVRIRRGRRGPKRRMPATTIFAYMPGASRRTSCTGRAGRRSRWRWSSRNSRPLRPRAGRRCCTTTPVVRLTSAGSITPSSRRGRLTRARTRSRSTTSLWGGTSFEWRPASGLLLSASTCVRLGMGEKAAALAAESLATFRARARGEKPSNAESRALLELACARVLTGGTRRSHGGARSGVGARSSLPRGEAGRAGGCAA